MSERNRIDVQSVDDVLVATCKDVRIIEDIGIQQLEQELFELAEQNSSPKILISFGKVVFISATAIGILISLDGKVKKAGGKLVFSNLPEQMSELFRFTRLDRFFDIKDDENEALASF